MGCKVFTIPGGQMFVCSRGSDRKPCKENGCSHPSEALCDWPLGGSKWGQSCSRPICKQHRFVQAEKLADGDTKDYCPGHDKMAKQPHIWCPRCHIPSWNPNDVEQHYCGKCDAFHADLLSASSPSDDHPF